MVVSLKHKFVPALADSGDAGEVSTNAWTDEHDLIVPAGEFLVGTGMGVEGQSAAMARGTMGAEDAGAASAAIAAHVAAADPHPGYLTPAEGNAVYSPLGHTHSTALDDLTDVTLASPSNGQVLKYNGTAWVNAADATGGGGGGLTDGDFGDITVSGTGTVMTIDNDAVTYAKMQNVSATDKILGRSTAGTGNVEEIACTAFGRSLIDDTNASTARATLELSDLFVNPKWSTYGAAGDGTTDDTTALANALATGRHVYLPKGVFRITAPLTLLTPGQRLIGESNNDSYILSDAATTHDLIRVSGSHISIENIFFRPGATGNVCIRIYGGQARIVNNRFLSAGAGSGTAILLDDVNPVGGGTVSGAYTHIIEGNKIGANATFEFQYAIRAICATNGLQATKFLNNVMISNTPFEIEKGGGNTYIGNQIQSRTGTIGAPVGTGINLGTNVTSEAIVGNYIERFQYGVRFNRVTEDYNLGNVTNNAWDHCTTNVSGASSPRFQYNDDEDLVNYSNGWKIDTADKANYKIKDLAGDQIVNINATSNTYEVAALAQVGTQSLSYTANGVSNTPTLGYCEITGSGGSRTGCFIGNGTRHGQDLVLRGFTWSVQILNTGGTAGAVNCFFAANATNVTFGNTTGQIAIMHLKWDANYSTGRWFEISRTLAA